MAATINYVLGVNTSQAQRQVQNLHNNAQSLFSRGINVVLNNRFSGPLGKITGDVKQFDKSLDAATARVLAFTSTTSILYAVGAAMKRLVGDAIAVEAALAKIQAISFSSSSSMKLFGDELFKIANKTSQSFTDVAAAAEEFSRQGLSTAETLKAVSAASVLAKLSGTSLAASIDGLVGIMQTFSAQALEYKDVVSLLTSVDAQFATSAAGLVDGLKRVSGVAADAGLTLQDTAAAIASVRQLTGRSEAVIGNGLKTIITNFRTEAVGKQLENIGVYTKDAQGNFRDLTSVIGEVQDAFSKLSSQAVEDISLKIAGKYQINNFKALLKSFKDQDGKGSLFDKAQKAANPDDNLTQKRIDILTNTTESKVKKLDNDFTQLGANLGTNLLKPAFDKTIDFISSITGLFNKLDGIAGPVLRGIADVLSGPTLLLGATVLGTLFFKLAREVGGVLAGLLNINRADERILSTQQLINDALVAADRTIVDQIRNATTLEAKYQAINRLVAQFIAQQNRNGGYSQGLYSTGSTIRTSGGGNGGGGGGGGGVAGAGGGVNYYGGAGGGGFTRYAPGSIVTPVNGQLPTTRTVNGNSIPAPITNPNVLYAGSTGRNGTAQTPFNTRTGRDIRPELINVPTEQKASTGLLAASLLTPLATGFASAFLRKTDSNGQSRETKGSQLVSDLGQSASSGLTTAFLATSFRTFSRFAGPLGLAVSAAQGLNSLGNFKSNALKGNLEDIGLNSEKRDKSIASLREYSGLTSEIRDAKTQGIPLYKIRALENKRNSLLGDISSDNAFGRSDSKFAIDRALNQDDQERALARAEATTYKRTSGTDITTALIDAQKKAYDKISIFTSPLRKYSASQNFETNSFDKALGSGEFVDPSRRYSFNELGGQGTVDLFSSFAQRIDQSALVKDKKETSFGKFVNESASSKSFSDIGVKDIIEQLKSSGYGNAGKAFEILQQGDKKIFEESLKAFFTALQESIVEAKRVTEDPKEVEKRNKKIRKEISDKSYEIDRSYEINAARNSSINQRRDFLINANKSILDTRNQNGQLSPEDYNSLSFASESKAISSNIVKGIDDTSEEFRKKFGDALLNSFDGFQPGAQNNILKAFQENGASQTTLDILSSEYKAKNGDNEELLSKVLKPLEQILSSRDSSIENIRNNGNQQLLEATFKSQQQDEQNSFIRRKERESALSPFGETLVNNLSLSSQDINSSSRNKTGEFLKNTILQKTTSELLNKPEYSFSGNEKRFDLSRREAQTKRETLAAIDSAKNNLSFLPLGANASQADIDNQNYQKTFYRNNLESLFQKSGNIDIKQKALGGLGRTFQELEQFQKSNPSSYTFGGKDLQRNIADKISNQDFSGASALLNPELQVARSKEFQDKFQGTSYGDNIKKFLENLDNIIERGKQETSLNPEVAKVEAEKIINRNAGDKTDPNNKTPSSLEEIMKNLLDFSKKIAQGSSQEVNAKVEMIVGVDFDPSKVFNNDSFKSSISEIVSSTVKSYLEANNTTGTPPVTPP